MSKFLKNIIRPFAVTALLLLLCGIAYPLLLTVVSGVFFPEQAAGSLLVADGRAVGSILVGQDFTDARFMKCRPSAVNYNTYTAEDKRSGKYVGLASGSNNYAPSNPALAERVSADIAEFLKANPSVKIGNIPTDLLTASGSGLDPHISPAAAAVQIPRLAEATGLSLSQLAEIVKKSSQGKFLGIFGEERVNVLTVNMGIAKALGMTER